MTTSPGKIQRIRDPLHNIISFDTANPVDAMLWQLVQTRPFQRLRRIGQLGFTDITYPGATHTRFAHSLGTLHTARRLLEVIRRHTPEYNPTRAATALAAALLHDIGHGPFSHAFEQIGKKLGVKIMARHELTTHALILGPEIAPLLNRLSPTMAEDVAALIKGEDSDIYSAIVSSQFDADRLDYMQRDSLMTGSQNASLDFEWLLANLEVGEVPYGEDDQLIGTRKTFVMGPKALHAAETYILSLFQLYPDIYHHKATRAVEMMFEKLLLQAAMLIREGDILPTGLPPRHPFVQFVQAPEDMEIFLKLDDTTLWGALGLMVEASDPDIARMADDILNRRLYKAVDIRMEIAKTLGLTDLTDDNSQRVLNRISTAVYEDLKQLNRNDVLPDQGSRSPYKTVQESKGSLNQILIRTPMGQLEDLGNLSRVVRAIQPHIFTRAYYPRGDESAKIVILSTIAKHTTKGETCA